MMIDRFFGNDRLDDAIHGQTALVAARWILILSGLFLALWAPGPVEELRTQIFFILALAVVNFYLHAQLLKRRPVVASLAYASSAADIAVITAIVISQGGVSSSIFNFYFPAMLVISVAFPTLAAFTFAGSVVAIYGAVGAFSGTASAAGFEDGTVVLTRLIMLAAVAVCGNLYWRIERDRRRAAMEARDELAMEIADAAAASDAFTNSVPAIKERS